MNRHALLLTLAVLSAGAATSSPPAMSGRDTLIQAFTQKPVGTVPLKNYTGQVRDFTLEVHRIQTEISPDVKVEQWAFAFPGQRPTVPGPELRVQVGDLVRITLVNTHDQPHTVHLHGITSLSQEMDGVPHTSQAILPGKSYTYAFVATEAGTHAYHCHMQTNVHLDMGMYGALIVEPRAGTPKPWQAEHTLILDEWDSHQNPADLKHDVHPDLFLVNGRTFPLIPDVQVPAGQVHLLRLINMGAQPHSLHLHGNSFLVIAKDGYDLPAPYQADTLPILPGERYDLLVKGRDGTFPFHDHNTPDNVNQGVYPGGQHFMLTGVPARKADGSFAPVSASTHDHSGTTGTGMVPAMTTRPAQTPATAHAHGNATLTTASTTTATLPAGSAVIQIREFEYTPGNLTVRAGTTVSWRNDDRVAHHVVLKLGGQDVTHQLPPGTTFSVQFDQPGTYAYHCLPHPFMQGVIRVK